MSFTALRGIERCPLQWALVHASYTGIWDGKGFPQRPNLATLMGQVVHGALETITRSFAKAAAGSSDKSITVAALRELGGISAVLQGELRKALHDAGKNPRVADLRALEDELQRKIPVMRQHTQVMLSAASAPQASTTAGGGEPLRAPRLAVGRSSGPLGEGVHAEQPLNHPDRTWFGKADLIRISKAACEIVDFKTGDRKEEHALQLRLYALLWYRDSTVNPSRRLATRLSLVYSDGEEDVAPPTVQDLEQLEAELEERRAAVLKELAAMPPVARPGPDVCKFCPVRQLCPAYWEPSVQGLLAEAAPVEVFRDADVRLHSRAGPWSWRAGIGSAAGLAPRSAVLVRTKPHDLHATRLLDSASHVRLLGAQILDGEDDGSAPPVISLTRGSEVFVVE